MGTSEARRGGNERMRFVGGLQAVPRDETREEQKPFWAFGILLCMGSLTSLEAKQIF